MIWSGCQHNLYIFCPTCKQNWNFCPPSLSFLLPNLHQKFWLIFVYLLCWPERMNEYNLYEFILLYCHLNRRVKVMKSPLLFWLLWIQKNETKMKFQVVAYSASTMASSRRKEGFVGHFLLPFWKFISSLFISFVLCGWLNVTVDAKNCVIDTYLRPRVGFYASGWIGMRS